MKFTLAFITLFSVSSLSAADWSRFRGPNGAGVANTTGLPSVVDDSTTVWKVSLGKGWSSPVLWQDMVIVTAETSATKRAVIAISAKDGKELWKHEEEFVPHPSTRRTTPMPAVPLLWMRSASTSTGAAARTPGAGAGPQGQAGVAE